MQPFCSTSIARGQLNEKESELKYIVRDIPMVCEHLCSLDWDEILSGDLAKLLIDFLPVLNAVITDRSYSPECRDAAQMIKEKLAVICGVDLIGLLPEVWDMSQTALRRPAFYFGREFDERRKKDPTAYRAIVGAFKAAAPLLIEQLREGLQARKFDSAEQPPRAEFPDERQKSGQRGTATNTPQGAKKPATRARVAGPKPQDVRGLRSNLPNFSQRHVDTLQAMKELGATSEKDRKTAEIIAKKRDGEADAHKVKAPLSELAQWGYVQSLTGRDGGSWLTQEGLKRLEEKEKQ